MIFYVVYSVASFSIHLHLTNLLKSSPEGEGFYPVGDNKKALLKELINSYMKKDALEASIKRQHEIFSIAYAISIKSRQLS